MKNGAERKPGHENALQIFYEVKNLRLGRFERPTPGFEVHHSIQLSYRRKFSLCENLQSI